MTLNNIFIIKDGKAEKVGSYYYKAQQVGKNELFDSQDKGDCVGECLNVGVVPTIRKNQINKYLRENKSFLISASFQAWDNSVRVNSWDDKMDLYLSQDDIVTMKESEEKREFAKGRTEYIKNIYFSLRFPLFLASAYDLLLTKTWEEIPQQWQSHAHALKENLEENRSFWKEKGKQKTINQYEKKIKEGFLYSVFTVSPRFETCDFIACCGVCRTEESPEYKRAEKIKELINKCVYSNNKLSIYEVLKILDIFNISIKRKGE